MINCNEPFSINTELSVVCKNADRDTKFTVMKLIDNQVTTVRDLVRLKDVDVLILTSMSSTLLLEIDKLLRQNGMSLGMSFNEVEDLVDIANVDVVAKKAVIRREEELKQAGYANAHEMAQEEYTCERLKLNDSEMTEWLNMGFAFIDEELALRKLWKEKMDAIRMVNSKKAESTIKASKFTIQNLKRYITHMLGLPNSNIK